MEGIEKHKATIINYQSLSATEPVEHEVYPYGLTYHRGSLYLIARPSDRQKMLHFKVDRIEEAVAGPFTFEPPEDFNVHDHLADSFGVFQGDGKIAIKVRFLPRVAPYVLESKWHDSQKLTKQKDGSVLAEFLLSNTEEIKRWILSFGQHAVVIEPELLRQEMNEELNGMQRLYSGPKRASHPSKQPKEGQPASEFKAETSAMR
jgi:proteasome accessory factor B